MRVLGLPLPDPLSLVGTAVGTAQGVASLVTTPRRYVRTSPGRLFVEVHGVQGSGRGKVARRVEETVESHPRVLWARVNGPTSRLVVTVADPPPDPKEIVALVRQAESMPVSIEDEVAEEESHHPAEGVKGTQVVPTLAVDALGLFISAITRIGRWAPLPPEVAGVLTAIDHHPALKERINRRAHGPTRAGSRMAMAGALAQGLAAGNEGILLDVVSRAGEWQEAHAVERAWSAVEERVVTSPESVAAKTRPTERPAPAPASEADRYAHRALATGALAGLSSAPFMGPRRALALGLATLPKPVEVGRSAFGSALGTTIARRGAIVMERSVLRRMDAIDAVVLDTPGLRTGALSLSALVPVKGADKKAIAEVAWRLFSSADPDGVAEDGEWWLGPTEGRDLEGPHGGKESAKALRQGASRVVGLGRGRRLQAVAGLNPESLPDTDLLTVAARRSGLPVYETEDPRGTVHELQERGHRVLCVSDSRRALSVADCGVGVFADGERPPWGAHVLVGTDLLTAAVLIEAVGAMRTVTTHSIRIAQAASAVGMISVLRGGVSNPTTRALRPVNAGAAIALFNARRHAMRLREPSCAAGLSTATVPWHTMPATVVRERLGSGERGLTDEEVERRAAARSTRRVGGTTLGSAFIAELANPLTPVMAGGAAVAAAVGSPVDAALVVAVVGLSALIGSVQQVRAERELAELLSRSAVSARVVRSGTERVVTADDLVPGDLVMVDAGDVVPADCRLVESTGLELDESSLTGESLPVAKDAAPVVASEVADRSSMVYEGTTVATGQGRAVVVAVGNDTEAGRSMTIAREGAPTTGVEARLTELTEKSLPLAAGSAAAVAGAGLLRGIPLRESLSAAVNLAIASVPEGLPFMVNAAQLAAARRLAEHRALVRNPRSIEALGRVDVLCFDKTGTLTEGRLTVSEVDDGRLRSTMDVPRDLRPVLASALRATPHAEEPGTLPHATDRAVAEAGARLGLTTATGAPGWEEVSTAPFESSRGLHATIGRTGDGLLLSVKGAPEEVLSRCDLGGKARKRLASRLRALAATGHRVLAVAERPLKDVIDLRDPDSVRGLEFRGFLGIADPVRDSAAPAAARLRSAGVQIVMLTGDHPATGEAIAAEISGHDDLTVVTGADLDELDEDGLRELLPNVDVIARCTPAHKVRIVEAYRALGKTVAMTGDGANDAPAIRLADVGIALGERGTPAARAAADLVVTDDRLETIIAALVEGRAMWASVRSALGVLLGGNLGEIAFTVLGATVSGRSPLGARQLLLVNMLTDLVPSMAIALRRPDGASAETSLVEGPESSLGTPLYREIGVRAATTAAGATTAWALARITGRRQRAGTVALAALVATQLGQTLVTGRRNPSVVASGVGSAAVLAAVIQTPGLSQFFGCTPLGPLGWGIALSSATAATAAGAFAGMR
ncbi:cation-translocating P-type ATPase [Saccharomonospora xinjiangensis]|uniref:P-type ATPase, translocating n=1 Tax=Saccharomonospora xinjiangensis XJ-54 TaxID=882086 RepID=I0V5D7_9PSEU|nr:cation-translocating P-type ATPase [Saccharomonospora xinjiangensis]EID55340.1 P-type ATPase, translocating [Saccharomonospora xinjiangensis XJ-54]